MTELENDLLKFLSKIKGVLSPAELQFIKETMLREYELGLITASEHCTIEAWIDGKGAGLC